MRAREISDVPLAPVAVAVTRELTGTDRLGTNSLRALDDEVDGVGPGDRVRLLYRRPQRALELYKTAVVHNANARGTRAVSRTLIRPVVRSS